MAPAAGPASTVRHRAVRR